MAKGIYSPKQVEKRVIEEVISEETFTLELTKEEVKMLSNLTGRFLAGGLLSQIHGQMYHMLREAGEYPATEGYVVEAISRSDTDQTWQRINDTLRLTKTP